MAAMIVVCFGSGPKHQKIRIAPRVSCGAQRRLMGTSHLPVGPHVRIIHQEVIAMQAKMIDGKGRLALGAGYAGMTVIVDDSNPNAPVVRPAAAISAREAWLYANDRAFGSLRRGLEQARAGRYARSTPNLDADRAIVDQRDDV